MRKPLQWVPVPNAPSQPKLRHVFCGPLTKVPEDAGVTWMWGNFRILDLTTGTPEVPIGTQVFVNWKSCAMG